MTIIDATNFKLKNCLTKKTQRPNQRGVYVKEKKGICQLGIILATALTFLFSCSDSREQFDRTNNVQPQTGDGATVVNQDTLSTLNFVGSGNKISAGGSNTTGQLSTEEEDRRIRENRVKPIMYDEGSISGINLKTTFEKASDILSTPEVYSTDSGPLYVYGEGIYIFWRDNAPRYPELIIVTGDYEGNLDTQNADYGKLFIGKSIAELYGPDELLGEGYMKGLFNILHNKEEGFDCMAARRCEIRYFEESNAILYMLPKLILRVSSDRKEIADMRIILDESSGEQNAPFDIIQGSFISPEGTSLSLGQTYGELLAFQKKPTEFIDPTTDGMNARYGKVYNVTTRSDYDRDYKVPSNEEVLKAFYLTNDFENVFMINGEVLNYTFSEEDRAYSLQRGSFEGSEPMIMKLGFDKNKGLKELQIPFLDDFRNIILEGMTELPGMKGYSSSGRNYIKDTDYMRNSVYQYDPITNTGKAVFFSMDRIQGNLSFIETDLLDSEFNRMIGDAYFTPKSVDLRAGLTSHGDFNFGDIVEFEKLDSTKETVTIKMNGMSERVNIDEHAIFRKVTLTEGKYIEREVMTVSPSNFPLTLILEKKAFPQQVGDQVTEVMKNVVTGISFSLSHDQAFSITCGAQNVELFFGQSDVKTLETLEGLSSCQKVMEYSTDGANQLETVYLPELKLMLNFDKNDFASVTTYQN